MTITNDFDCSNDKQLGKLLTKVNLNLILNLFESVVSKDTPLLESYYRIRNALNCWYKKQLEILNQYSLI